MTARSPSRASTTISPPICACAGRARRRREAPARSASWPQASYDDPEWAFLSAEQKRDWTDFDHFDLARPDFLSWNVDDLPHKIPFLMKELTGAPVIAWTVRNTRQREAARKWADQIVFDGEENAVIASEGKPSGAM